MQVLDRRNDLVDEPEFLRLRRLQPLPAEQDLRQRRRRCRAYGPCARRHRRPVEPDRTSGRPTTALASSTMTPVVAARQISVPPPSAAPLIAATTGLPSVSSRRSVPSSADVVRRSARRPPGRPAADHRDPLRRRRSSWPRDDDAPDVVPLGYEAIDRRRDRAAAAAVKVLADWLGSSSVRDDDAVLALPVADRRCVAHRSAPPRPSRCPCPAHAQGGETVPAARAMQLVDEVPRIIPPARPERVPHGDPAAVDVDPVEVQAQCRARRAARRRRTPR